MDLVPDGCPPWVGWKPLPYSSETVDKPFHITLGKRSDRDAVTLKPEDLGRDLPEEVLERLVQLVQQRAMLKRGAVTDTEFLALLEGEIWNVNT